VPGLLFFYLFADEISTYSLIVRREHRYTVELNAIVSNSHSQESYHKLT